MADTNTCGRVFEDCKEGAEHVRISMLEDTSTNKWLPMIWNNNPSHTKEKGEGSRGCEQHSYLGYLLDISEEPSRIATLA